MLKYKKTMIHTLCVNSRNLPKYVPNEVFVETDAVLYQLVRCEELTKELRRLLFKLNDYIIGKLGKNLYSR